MTQNTETTARQPIAREFVREDKLPQLAERLVKMNKQASKVGAEPITAEPTGAEETRVTKIIKDARGGKREIAHLFIEIQVFGDQPKMPGGFTLLGVVDHREALALVNEVPGQTMPAGQRDRGPICDHCEAIRRRSDTFVLRSEAGEVVQVGRQCLGDFLGVSVNDPSRALLFFMGVGEVLGFGDDDDFDMRAYGGSGGSGGWRMDVEGIVQISAAIIDVNGFVSRSRCEQVGQEATSSRVMDFIDPPRFSSNEAAARAEFESWVAKVSAKMTPELDEEVTAAIEWAATQTGDSEFIQNVATLAQLSSVSRKYLGTVVWIIAGYRKAQQRLRETANKAELFGNSQHFGEIKKRMEAELTLIEVRAIDGHFGTSYLTTFVTTEGNKVKWFASNDPTGEYGGFEGGWEIGQTRHVKLTPKNHGEWQGTPETGVNRVAEFIPKVKKTKKSA